MKLYIESLKMHLKSTLEYKASFIISFLSQILVFFSHDFIIIALFTKFNNIKGFTLYEVLLCFGIIQLGFSINETFARGIDRFDVIVKNGDFDRFLLRPKNLILQVLCNNIDFVKLSRVIQAIIVLAIALNHLDITWTISKVITLILMILSSILIFFGIFTISAALCFITIDGIELRNVFTDGGREMAKYPIGIFKKELVFVLTFIIPYGLVNYYPLLYFLGKSNKISYMLSPILVAFYLIPAFIVFYQGVKRYSSIGS